MKRTWWMALVVTALIVVGCGKGAGDAGAAHGGGEAKETASREEGEVHAEGEEGGAEGGPVVLTPEQERVAGIALVTASSRLMQAELTVPGVIAPANNAAATVTPPVAGRIIRLTAAVGDQVRQGQPLAVVQSSELAQGAGAVAEAQTRVLEAEATVRQAYAEVDLARARSRTAAQTLARQRQLAQAGVFSQPGLQTAQNELSEAQTEVASAKSDVAARQNVLDRAERLFAQGLVAGAEVDQARVDLQQARIRQDRAQERLDIARQAFERENRVSRAGLLNAREIQAAEAEARAARLEVDRERIKLSAAQAALEGARRGVQNARSSATALRGGSPGAGSTVTLTAPIAGVVTERRATIGQAVERSSYLFDIENLRNVFVTANVPERDVAKVRTGISARITTDAYPGRAFSGVVRIVGARLDPKTRTMPVQILVENPSGALRPDMFARVSIGIGGGTRALAIPRSALVGPEEKPAAFVREGEGYERRELRLGRTSGELVEVLSGIEPGEKVVAKGGFVLMSQQQKGELKGDED